MSKKILVICPYPEDTGASQRLKFEPHINDWRALGFSVDVASFVDIKTFKILYCNGYFVRKGCALVKGFLKRIFLLLRLRQYDIIYLHMWYFPILGAGIERLPRFLCRRLIYDMEDLIFLQRQRCNSGPNRLLDLIRSVDKYKYLVESSDFLIVSTRHVEKICTEMRGDDCVKYVPPSIDLSIFRPLEGAGLADVVSIGWTGTFSSLPFLDSIAEAIKAVARIREIRLIVISNAVYRCQGIDVINIEWRKLSEVSDLQSIDIGVYPTFDDPWVEGKSGLKAIQYMACGIPVVASPYGNVSEVFTDGIEGFYARSLEDWTRCLLHLVDSPEVRLRLGSAGRERAEMIFSKQVVGAQYVDILTKANF